MPTNQTNQSFDINQFMQKFLEETVDHAGFGDLPADFKQKYKDKLEIAMHKKIGTVLNNLLKDEDVEELGKFLQAKPNFSNEELFKFYSYKIPDLPEKIADAMKAFRQDFLSLALKTAGGAGMV